MCFNILNVLRCITYIIIITLCSTSVANAIYELERSVQMACVKFAKTKGSKTTFNLDWINPEINKRWSQIFKEVKNNPFSVNCTVCLKTFSLSNMGKAALMSHEKSAAHKKRMGAKLGNQNTLQFPAQNDINNNQPENNVVIEDLNTTQNENKPPFFLTEVILEAEILWALHTVESHESLNSVNKSLPILKRMFPNGIAEKMRLCPKKLSYLITFGLATYFNEELEETILKCDFYVACFDESLNQIAQRGQMDLVIRYWHKEKNIVDTRYFKSIFMNGATAEDILYSFDEGLKPLKKSKLIQVSMDGPNVNWKFKRLLEESDEVNIIDLGSCGLHVIHGAFQSGHKAAQCTLNEFLLGIYWLFKDSPARRISFKKIVGEKNFPLKFRRTRWVESSAACYRAIEILSSIKTYVNNENTKLPSTTSVKNVKKNLEDILLKPKLSFFATIASALETFLKKYQSPASLVPFLYKDLDLLVRSILLRFVKKEHVSNKSTNSLFKLDFKNPNIYLNFNKIDCGFRTKRYLEECEANERQKIDFFKDCRNFLISLVKKIFKRSPLKYKAVKAASCLDPEILANDEQTSKTRMNSLLEIFCDNNLLSLETAEKASLQFNDVLNKVIIREYYNDYKKNPVTLDVFYNNIFTNNTDYGDVFNFIKMVLILSHGNASVESGFSINKNMLIENMHEKSLIGRRQVYDAIVHTGGAVNINITKKIKLYAKNAHFKYTKALNDQKTEEEEEQRRLNERKRSAAEIIMLEKKKAKILDIAQYEKDQIDRQLSVIRKNI